MVTIAKTKDGSKRPLVNVVVPTYNRLRRLRLALASIWSQQGLGEAFDLEPIVVDDASPEPAEEVVRAFPGTRYVRLDANRGLAVARNAGLAEASGDYVAFLDDDDLWLPDRLFAQVAALEAGTEPEIAYGRSFVCMHDGSWYVDPPDEGPSGLIFEHVYKQESSNLFTMLIPRAVFEKVGGFDETFPDAANGMVEGIETDLVLRLALIFPFRYVPGVVTVIIPSPANHREPQVRQQVVLLRKEKILALSKGQPNESDIARVVSTVTQWHVVRRYRLAGDQEGTRRELLVWLEQIPSPLRDPWATSRLSQVVVHVALASDRPVETASALAGEIEGSGRRAGVDTGPLLADTWTRLALALASRPRRDDRLAARAALRAIASDPRRPLSRPGLVRLLARGIRRPKQRLGSQRAV